LECALSALEASLVAKCALWTTLWALWALCAILETLWAALGALWARWTAVISQAVVCREVGIE
jgi:hypothetical protein